MEHPGQHDDDRKYDWSELVSAWESIKEVGITDGELRDGYIDAGSLRSMIEKYYRDIDGIKAAMREIRKLMRNSSELQEDEKLRLKTQRELLQEYYGLYPGFDEELINSNIDKGELGRMRHDAYYIPLIEAAMEKIDRLKSTTGDDESEALAQEREKLKEYYEKYQGAGLKENGIDREELERMLPAADGM